ncbi:wax ester/triacylglycerol synthase family O-acyltransferase [Amycolatopsis alba]|uniref:Diacylglycerol O-acyltransferase n=1 Tax=Amycolatopsis alba DSM 44262 TaxID=1125972 RepID=A0A229RFJ3_AMYAL|nr:wax ester/triacylglycerol synthase family O-acyltransferase [Amycolatopsis alba]OXM45426.1 wax ester/triacylglycerol synthase family O-acyltransferase [Amycolatopsis alba DSM 44262]
MDRLGPLDAAFLELEDGDSDTTLSIASVAILEGPAPPPGDFAEVITSKLPLVPRYRQKIHRVPLDLGPPVWVDDDRFDASRHFHRVLIPVPGDENALCELVALLMSERLDRDHPLWEFWVIEGLSGGRWAVLSKVHHCLVDGVAGNALLKLMFSAEDPAKTATEPERDPGTAALLLNAAREIVSLPVDLIRGVGGLVMSPNRAARLIADTAKGLTALASALIPTARSSLSGPIGPGRRYEVARTSLADIGEIRAAFDVTMNDVVLASITSAFRDVLLRRGEKPLPDSVRTLVPVSVRGDAQTLDNRVSLMLPLLPVDIPDPTGRLLAVHRRLAQLKAGKEAEAGAALTGAGAHTPFAPIAWAIRLAANLPQHNVVTVTTNVPGPVEPLRLLGREVLELYPYVPIAMRLRSGVAVLSYRDKVTFGVTLDFASSPEAGFFAKAIEHDLESLLRLARESQA